jgi:hypothetical protein
LEKAAEQGNALAIKELDGPELPECLRYLWEFHLELRRGVREMMTWVDYDAWTRQTGNAPDSDERDALFYMDVIYRNPPTE